MKQLRRTAPILLALTALASHPAALAQPEGGAATAAAAPLAQFPADGEALLKSLFLENRDMVTVSGRSDSLIRLRPRPNGTVQLTKQPLPFRLKPKGVAYSKQCEKVAIANSTNVVVYDVWTRAFHTIESIDFGLIADVEYDMACNLIIADMGGDSVGRWPRDGHVWLYSPQGHLRAIGTARHSWVNPAFLDMDEWGTLYVVDKAAGKVMPGSGGEWHFDAIYKMGAPDYKRAKKRFNKPGLEVTAFMAHPDGRFFIGNGDELVVLDDKKLRYPCGNTSFQRINGIDINQDFEIFLVDGFDVFGETDIYRLSGTCKLRRVDGDNRMLNGVQGLATALPAR